MPEKAPPTEFLNSVIQGLVELSYNWEGSGYGTMASLVGTALLDQIALPEKQVDKNREALVDELCALLEGELTSRFGVCAKVKLYRSEKQGLTVEVDNCVLIPIEDYLINKGMRSRRPFCPVANVIIESLSKLGIDAETRSWEIGTREKCQCHHVIGLMDEVAAATEIKAGKTS